MVCDGNKSLGDCNECPYKDDCFIEQQQIEGEINERQQEEE